MRRLDAEVSGVCHPLAIQAQEMAVLCWLQAFSSFPVSQFKTFAEAELKARKLVSDPGTKAKRIYGPAVAGNSVRSLAGGSSFRLSPDFNRAAHRL